METETTPTGVQPGEVPEGTEAAGQGTEGIQGLYDLSEAPEHLRPLLEQELKKVDANVTRRFQEHAEFRQKLGPLAEMDGLADVPTEELSQLLEFREIAANPEAFESWWFEVGKDLGFFEDDGAGPEAGVEGEQDGPENLAIAQLVETVQSLTQRLEEFESKGQTEKAQAEARQEIDRQLGELRDQHGEFDESLVLRLARDYAQEPDAIQRGFEDMLKITGQAQNQLVSDKLDQPASATRGGLPDTTGSQPTTFKEAQAAALQRLGG